MVFRGVAGWEILKVLEDVGFVSVVFRFRLVGSRKVCVFFNINF